MSAQAITTKRGFWASLFGVRESYTPTEIADAEVAQRRKGEEEKRWGEILSRPAHEYQALLLEQAGLPPDVREVIGRTCSFWAKNPDEIWATSISTLVQDVRHLGGHIYLYFSDGNYAFFVKGVWKYVSGSTVKDTVHFCLL